MPAYSPAASIAAQKVWQVATRSAPAIWLSSTSYHTPYRGLRPCSSRSACRASLWAMEASLA